MGGQPGPEGTRRAGGDGTPPDESDPLSGSSGKGDSPAAQAVALLYRAIRPEPHLRLGAGEATALTLAPLVAAWLERGCRQ